MDIKQLQQGLENKFAKSRIVFWHDADLAFSESLEQLALPNVTLINMGEVSHFETKKRIELDEPKVSFLLYYPSEVPEFEVDWLLDIREYSESFFADVSSLILNQLNIPKMSLRSHIQTRMAFFSNKQRVAKLKRMVVENETAESLDQKILAVLVKSETANLNDVTLSAILMSMDSDSSTLMAELNKYGLQEVFWQLLSCEYGYETDKPTIEQFILRLFSTELWLQTELTDRSWLDANVVQGASGKSNVAALMKFWRHHGLYQPSYLIWAARLESDLEIEKRYGSISAEQLSEAESFEGIEKTIIRYLVGGLTNHASQLNKAWFEEVISNRMTHFWVSEKSEYRAMYLAIKEALTLIMLREKFDSGFYYETAEALYSAYEKELFQFDQAYRLFNEFADDLFSKGAEILRQLDKQVENIYTSWFLTELSLAWDKLIEAEGLMAQWQLPNKPRQPDFYKSFVAKPLKTTQLKRMFVVISDALRYEVAEEFTRKLNDKKQFKAQLQSQLGVLPSYTQLGMASLLPYTELSYKDGNNTVFVDGLSSKGSSSRQAILNSVNGLVVTDKTLASWTASEGREKLREYEVVYIYHNTIDDICDKQGGEDKTPKVCRDAINELMDLMGRIINRFNASRVMLTADHGFLFQQAPLEQSDKTAEIKVNDVIEAKKRHIVGKTLPSYENCWKGSVKHTANGDNTEFLLPKGVQRFHFVGGAKFVHGGASLQEVCVPVIEIKELEGKKIAQHQKQSVGVVSVAQNLKLVNNLERIKLLQSDPVGETFKARTLEIFVQDSAGLQVSTVEKVAFESTEENFDARIKEVRIRLTGQSFDRHQFYQLVLRDEATNTVYSEYPVKIDLAIEDDFF
ncbi:BREX-1 system phosphatase PglZ type A [Hydrogenovibrio sp. SC-1]|nr:BREX-1 system phosphatase PglZ type A [Hydrogenovibrio sp. SC-1]